mgnify:CR=1 FL=1
MVVFKKITWQNFLSTGNAANTVVLDSSPSTLIVGKNGEGKSTILDALCFSLFGKPFRNINKPQLVNSINGKGCRVEIEFEIGSNSYRVVRGIKPNIFEIYHNGNLVNQDSALKDYQNVLEQQILKLNYKTFVQVVILGSASFVPFMQLTPQARRDVIEDILDIKIFSTMNVVLKEKIQKTKDEMQLVESDISTARARVEAQQKLISVLQSNRDEAVESLNLKIDENLQKIQENQDIIAAKQSDVKKLREKLAKYSKFSEELQTANAMVHSKKAKSSQLSETIEFFESNDSCPSCLQGIPHDHKSSVVSTLKEQLSTNDSHVKDITKAVQKIKEKIEVANSINSEIGDLNVEISGINSIISTLTRVNNDYIKERTKLSANTGDIGAEKDMLKVYAADVISLIEKKTKLSETRAMQDVASALLKDGGIKTKIIEKYLPVINGLINKYLQQMDFYVYFELDESFNETIKSRHRDTFSYSSFSEGEKQKIDVALLFTWRQVARMKNSVNTNLLLMDEIFDSSLDANSTELLMSLMSNFDDNQNIFVISHKNESLLDKFSRTLTLEKKNDFSNIVEK